MKPNENPYQAYSAYAPTADMADTWERAAFIRRTYAHLAGAIAAFVAIEAVIFTAFGQDELFNMVKTMMGGRFSWLIVLAAFMGVSWLARSWASSSTSQAMQYAGLALYVVAQAVIFVPMLFIAFYLSKDPNIVPIAGILTGIIFGGLTAVVFFSKADFSGLGKYLAIAGFAALGFIVCSMIFSFSLGIVFTCAMIALMAGYILYDTSNVLHHYNTNQHVAAALALFASVALLFWYVLQLVMSLNRD